MQTLRAAEWAGGMPMPSGGALFPGFYLNELLLRCWRGTTRTRSCSTPMRRRCRRWREPDEAQAQAALRAFELMLLREIGVLPDLSGVTLTHAAGATRRAATCCCPEAGVARRAGRAEPPSPARSSSALQAALDARQRGRAARRLLAPRCRRCAAALRALLHYHLGTPVLRTRQVMADVRKLLDRPQARR